MVQILLQSRGKVGKALPSSLTFKEKETAGFLFDAVAKATGKSVDRIRLTVPLSDKPSEKDIKDTKKKPTLVLKHSDVIGSLPSVDGTVTVQVKDLGPQIGWRTVFLIEYLGPLLIHPVFFFLQKPIYGFEFEHTDAQRLVFVLILMHFVKREFETAFVHKFSLSTMPVFNLFKNSAHYWVLSGVNLAYFVYAPPIHYSGIKKLLYGSEFYGFSQNALVFLGFFWMLFERSNLKIHLDLSNMRDPQDPTRRLIPKGFGFNWVSFPNYFFESMSWLMVAIISQNWSAWLFWAVGTAQMWVWAVKKHKRYLKEFPDYPKDRKVMVPYLF